MTITRGVRNNNPGNIDYVSANKWRGQLPPNPAIEKRFARFDTPENGIRALCKLLLTYQNKYGLKTVKDIISRWAPSAENDTAAYVRAVELSIGIRSGVEVDLCNEGVMKGFVKAIIHHENAGFEYPQAVLDEGVRRGLT
ncbi:MULTISPECIES: structural protein [Pseudomonas]|uniref:structural protein n=1 Tax=Pseudomonas TaxID=286 RepID=UPI001BE86DF8|nr:MULTISPECIES: structural protein [Pseudomonas]MBT2339519.1 structural protein [Pseudomonas fluorescens]MCD4528683.1 structural protein [Pseudomonas sp. C3-2018]